MITLMKNGNIGVTSTSLHPDGHSYVLLKRDVPGSAILLYEQDWNGMPTRLIKLWAKAGDLKTITSNVVKEERAAGRPGTFPTEAVDGPIASPSLICRPDGSILLNHVFGGGRDDGYTDWQVEILPNVCAPFTYHGTWPLTVSATDDQARRLATSAQGTAERAASMAAAADDEAGEAMKRVKAIVQPDILKVVSDDITSDQGRLRHALWPRVLAMVADAIYVQLKDAASPLINTIRNGGQVIK